MKVAAMSHSEKVLYIFYEKIHRDSYTIQARGTTRQLRCCVGCHHIPILLTCGIDRNRARRIRRQERDRAHIYMYPRSIEKPMDGSNNPYIYTAQATERYMHIHLYQGLV